MDERTNPFLGRRVAFVGKLGGMNTREASALVRRLGGTPVSSDDSRLDLLVLGAEEPLADADQLHAAERPGIAVLSETEVWRRLGLLEQNQGNRRLYTPAMLADLLGVPTSVIRRWHRNGLIQAQETVHRLPYFGFAEIAVARQLAELRENGATTAVIETQLRELARHQPNSTRPLAQLAVVVEGRRLLVKQDGAVLEPGGQRRFDFESLASSDGLADDDPATIPMPFRSSASMGPTREQLIAAAEEADESGDLPAAADAYRAALAAGPPSASLCFSLAECLYRLSDLSAARERYAMAIELDETFVEARANLGCVLAELGQTELAIAALQGALQLHPDYADAHLHLAQLLELTGETQLAQQHRRRFSELAPANLWTDQGQYLALEMQSG